MIAIASTLLNIPAAPVHTRASLATWLRRNRRALKLGRPEIWNKGKFDPNYDTQVTEGIHTYVSGLGKVFLGSAGASAILDVTIYAAE